MNLLKLFEAQKVLRDRIAYNEPDRFNKLILALLVELGECANEQRSWKFWSTDQEPRNFMVLSPKYPSGGNPLLEEYVDGLHFLLELGIELETDMSDSRMQMHTHPDITSHFNSLFVKIGWLQHLVWTDSKINQILAYKGLFWDYIGLGAEFGFTGAQIEQAYFAKNKVNHERQDNGY